MFCNPKENRENILEQCLFGYKKDLKDKYHLIVDRKAAEVVKIIFKMFLEGYGTMQIADYLSKQKIPIPADYNKRKRGAKSDLTVELLNDYCIHICTAEWNKITYSYKTLKDMISFWAGYNEVEYG